MSVHVANAAIDLTVDLADPPMPMTAIPMSRGVIIRSLVAESAGQQYGFCRASLPSREALTSQKKGMG